MNRINQIKNLTVLLSYFLTVFLLGCNEEGRVDHIDYSAPAPVQVSQVTIRNTNGGAVLKYKVPADKNLMYVKAVYDIQPGMERQTKSSAFGDSIILEGFGDTKPHDVLLYSVGKNEKMSEPLPVQVNPLTAPVHLASVRLVETFGGIAIYVDNPKKAELAIEFMLDTTNNGYKNVRTYYTSSAKTRFTYRGLDGEREYNCAAYLRDRWKNYTEMTPARLTPMFEEFIPKNTWTHIILDGDNYLAIELNRPEYRPEKAWDGIINNENMMFAPTPAPFPHWVTWDMGMTAIIGRLKIWHRGPGTRAWINNPANVKKFELWGSMNPNPDGSWDETWIPLGSFECVKPSEGEMVTDADHYYANVEGIDFDMGVDEFSPDPFVPVRFIRFKCNETFEGATPAGTYYLNEISFWGKILN